MSKELKGITIIVIIYLLGEVLSRIIGGFIPGNVLGMLILFGLLQHGAVKEEDIKGMCNFVLSNMMLLFIPVTAGIVISYKMIAHDWIAVIATLLISTILVLIVVGYVQQYLGKKWKR
ncbi:MAG: CidA/LrgA family protein [Rikenellaceae bacterium]